MEEGAAHRPALSSRRSPRAPAPVRRRAIPTTPGGQLGTAQGIFVTRTGPRRGFRTGFIHGDATTCRAMLQRGMAFLWLSCKGGPHCWRVGWSLAGGDRQAGRRPPVRSSVADRPCGTATRAGDDVDFVKVHRGPRPPIGHPPGLSSGARRPAAGCRRAGD